MVEVKTFNKAIKKLKELKPSSREEAFEILTQMGITMHSDKEMVWNEYQRTAKSRKVIKFQPDGKWAEVKEWIDNAFSDPDSWATCDELKEALEEEFGELPGDVLNRAIEYCKEKGYRLVEESEPVEEVEEKEEPHEEAQETQAISPSYDPKAYQQARGRLWTFFQNFLNKIPQLEEVDYYDDVIKEFPEVQGARTSHWVRALIRAMWIRYGDSQYRQKTLEWIQAKGIDTSSMKMRRTAKVKKSPEEVIRELIVERIKRARALLEMVEADIDKVSEEFRKEKEELQKKLSRLEKLIEVFEEVREVFEEVRQ